jgi:hypothetical protein
MGHLNMEVVQYQPKKKHLEWRRARVLELSSQGRTEREIAANLKVGLGTVVRDIAYLNKQARESLQVHIQERLPEQYRKCNNGLTQVLKMAWDIVLSETGTASNHSIRLQALSLINDCYKYQMDLTTNGIIVNDAIKYVQGKMDHLNNQEKKLLHDIKEREDAEAETEEVTTNGVF